MVIIQKQAKARYPVITSNVGVICFLSCWITWQRARCPTFPRNNVRWSFCKTHPPLLDRFCFSSCRVSSYPPHQKTLWGYQFSSRWAGYETGNTWLYSTSSSLNDLTNIYCLVGWGCKIHRLLHWRRVRPHPTTSVLDMTLNNMMVRFQQCWSFGECGVFFYCHRSLLNSGPEW